MRIMQDACHELSQLHEKRWWNRGSSHCVEPFQWTVELLCAAHVWTGVSIQQCIYQTAHRGFRGYMAGLPHGFGIMSNVRLRRHGMNSIA